MQKAKRDHFENLAAELSGGRFRAWGWARLLLALPLSNAPASSGPLGLTLPAHRETGNKMPPSVRTGQAPTGFGPGTAFRSGPAWRGLRLYGELWPPESSRLAGVYTGQGTGLSPRTHGHLTAPPQQPPLVTWGEAPARTRQQEINITCNRGHTNSVEHACVSWLHPRSRPLPPWPGCLQRGGRKRGTTSVSFFFGSSSDTGPVPFKIYI